MDDKNTILCRCEDLTREDILKCIQDGYRTIDIMPQEEDKRNAVTQVGTAQMGDLICERI